MKFQFISWYRFIKFLQIITMAYKNQAISIQVSIILDSVKQIYALHSGFYYLRFDYLFNIHYQSTDIA
jgi:hypothetical protein